MQAGVDDAEDELQRVGVLRVLLRQLHAVRGLVQQGHRQILDHVVDFSVECVRSEHVPVLLADLLEGFEGQTNFYWVRGVLNVLNQFLNEKQIISIF